MRRIALLGSMLLAGVTSGCAVPPPPGLEFKYNFLGIGVTLPPGHAVAIFWALVAIVLGLIIWAGRLRSRTGAPTPTGLPAPAPLDFASWLAAQNSRQDPLLTDLQQYAANRNWHLLNSQLQVLQADITADPVPGASDKMKRLAALAIYRDRWAQDVQAGAPSLLGQILRDLRTNLVPVFLCAFAIAVFVLLVTGITNTGFFSSLAQVDQARGLITFLIAIIAGSVILLTAINIFLADGASFANRFSAAKDLVTIVMGVLGTILGFYFGSSTGDRAMSIADVRPANYSVVSPGDRIEISANVRGGTGPFKYDVLLSDAAGNPVMGGVTNQSTEADAIRQSITVPSVAKTSTITASLLVRDSRGLQARGSTFLTINPKDASGIPPAQGSGAEAGGANLSLADLHPVANTDIASGQSVRVSARAQGGAAPYTFDVIFADREGHQLGDGRISTTAPAGNLTGEIKAPKVEKDTSAVLSFTATDSKGQKTNGTSTVTLKP